MASHFLSTIDRLMLRNVGFAVPPYVLDEWKSLDVASQRELLCLFAQFSLHHLAGEFVNWFACRHTEIDQNDSLRTRLRCKQEECDDEEMPSQEQESCMCEADRLTQVKELGEAAIYDTSEQPFLQYELEDALEGNKKLQSWVLKADYRLIIHWLCKDIMPLMIEMAAKQDAVPEIPSVDDLIGQFRRVTVSRDESKMETSEDEHVPPVSENFIQRFTEAAKMAKKHPERIYRGFGTGPRGVM